MWPFGGRPAGRTVAEMRKVAAEKAARLASEVGRLHARVIKLERQIPYVRSHQAKKSLELQKLRIEERIRQLEKQHHELMRV